MARPPAVRRRAVPLTPLLSGPFVRSHEHTRCQQRPRQETPGICPRGTGGDQSPKNSRGNDDYGCEEYPGSRSLRPQKSPHSEPSHRGQRYDEDEGHHAERAFNQRPERDQEEQYG